MAIITWQAAVSGDWSDAADWSTDTVPTSTDEAEFEVTGNYTVTVTSADTANSLLFDAPGAELVESAAGGLLLNELILDEGSIELDGTNTIDITEIGGGVLTLGAAGALDGGGDLTISGGELLATANETLTNPLSMSGGFTIAAAPGTTLNLDGSAAWSIAVGATVNFGAPGVTGTIVWFSPSSSVNNSAIVNVRGGVLKAGDANFSNLVDNNDTTVSAGATIDLAGFSTTIEELDGAGTVTTSSGSPTLTLEGGDFSGTIAGALSLTVLFGGEFQGANTYTGDTTIEDGPLTLGPGGSIAAASPIIIDDAGELILKNSGPLTLANAISGGGFVVFEGAGTATINTANTYSGFTIIDGGGALAVGNSSALGSSDLGLDSGELLGTATETLTNRFVTGSGEYTAVTIAAASGTTMTMESAAGWSLASGWALDFGAAGETGTIVWFSPSGSVNNGAAINVNDGTLKAGDGNLGDLVDGSSVTTIASGATLDLGGFSTTIADLQGAGAIANSGGAATLTVAGNDSNFAGTISGPIVLTIANSLVFTGSDESTGTITIGSGDYFQLGAGSSGGTATGSIAPGSAVVDNGTFDIDRSNAVTLANSISGSGGLMVSGNGVTTIDTSNFYTGGTNILFGSLAIGSADALGSGEVIDQGALEATATMSLSNQLDITSGAFAAADGTTFTIGANAAWTTNGLSLTFGATGQDGTVLWSNAAGGAVSDPGDGTIDVAAGTLKAVDAGLNQLLSGSAAVTVAAGATLDIAGFPTTINGLGGAGTVTDSGGAAVLTLADSSTFSGTLSGALFLELKTNVEFNNDGTYDLAAGSSVAPASGATDVSFVNNGLFELTAVGAGVSTVSTLFTDNGEVAVTSGSIQFTDGFGFVGVVEGVMSQSGGVTTVAANAPGQSTFYAGSGDDLINVTTAPTYVDGGAGFDTLEIAASMTLAAGSINNIAEIEIDGGVTANLSQLFSGEAGAIVGEITGTGTLAFAGGTATISSAALSVSHLSETGSGTTVTLGENLDYAGSFSQGSGSTLNLGGNYLVLTGGAAFSGATVTGSNRIYDGSASTTISGLTIGGTVVLEVSQSTTQSGGNVTVGDAQGDFAELYNTSGTYAIADNSGIGRGSSTSSLIKNTGLFEKTGGTETSAISASFTDSGTVTVATGTLSFSGPSNSFAGAITGSGTVLFAGGTTTLASGTTASVSHLSETGSGTTVTLGENLDYAGAFSQGSGSTLNLTSDYLVLTGGAAFSGGTVTGSNRIYDGSATTTISGLTIGGTVVLEVSQSTTQSGGNVTVGDAQGDIAELYNTSTGTYTITDNSGIGRGSSTSSLINNAGLFEKTGGTGTSAITPNILNGGTIEVASGTLDLQGALSGTGGLTIAGASTLEVDSTVGAGQTVTYSGTSGDLVLDDLSSGGSQLFHGTVAGFVAGDTLDAGAPFGAGTTFTYTENAGGAAGVLALTDGSLHASINLAGDYIQADFHTQTSNGGTLFTYHT